MTELFHYILSSSKWLSMYFCYDHGCLIKFSYLRTQLEGSHQLYSHPHNYILYLYTCTHTHLQTRNAGIHEHSLPPILFYLWVKPSTKIYNGWVAYGGHWSGICDYNNYIAVLLSSLCVVEGQRGKYTIKH